MDDATAHVVVLTPLETRGGRVASGQRLVLSAPEAALLASVGAVRLVEPEAAPAPAVPAPEEPAKIPESAAQDAPAAPAEPASVAPRPRAPRKPRA
jgi:hypothetical protein